MSKRSESLKRYCANAKEARTYAIGANMAHRVSLLKIAEEYERMAREIEAVEATKDALRLFVSLSYVAE